MNEVDYFSGDRFVAKMIIKLRDQFNIDTAIETGSHIGCTSTWLSENFKQVYGIEVEQKHFDQAKINCSKISNINFFLGDSRKILPKLLDEIKDRCLFFLDAHGYYDTPTSKELEIIAEHCKVKPIIVIHDFYNPNNPKLKFDTFYDFVYKWESIEKLVNQIYGENFEYWYNNESEGDNVGVIYIVPKLPV